MRITTCKSIAILIGLFCCLTATALADLKVKEKVTSGEQGSENTVMIKGARQRTELSNAGIINILQCDLKRTLLINDNTHKYLITALDQSGTPELSAPASSTPSEPTRRGGIITYTTTTTATGETKKMFGFVARHLKTKTTIESSPDACNPENTRYETDGWYINLDFNFDCAATARPTTRTPQRQGGCRDEVRTRSVGAAKPGFALMETFIIYDANGAELTRRTTEVVELSSAPLDAALFDVPAGYVAANNSQELYGINVSDMMNNAMSGNQQSSSVERETASEVAPKRPGTIRIGVATIMNKTDRNVSLEALREQLISALGSSGVEAVPLNSSNLDAEAKRKGCDFILTNEISSFKQSSGKKIGGLLGRATGVNAPLGKSEARIEFKLTAVGNSLPQLQSSATAKDEGDEASVGVALQNEAQQVLAEAKKKM